MSAMRPRSLPPAISLAAVCLAALALPLTFTGGAVAAPAIGREFDADPRLLAWITNGFMLSFGSLLLPAGGIADRWGRRRVFLGGLTVFLLGALVASATPNLLAIDLLRGLQGIGAAGALSAGGAILAQLYEGRARSLAFSLLGTMFGLGLAVGPAVAGLVSTEVGWRAALSCGAPAAALALGLGAIALPESRAPGAPALDVPGALAFSLALGLFTVAVMEAPRVGWWSGQTVGQLVASAVVFVLFVGLELRSPQPLLDLTLLARPDVLGVQLLPVATCYGYVVLLVLLPARFIGLDAMGEAGAGLMLVWLSAPMVLIPALAGYLSRWAPAQMICGAGLIIAAAGLVWLSHQAIGASPSRLAGPLLLIGMGAALPWGLMDGLAVSLVPPSQAGMAAGLFGATRVAGEGVALALVNGALATRCQALIAAGAGHAAGTEGRLAGLYLAQGDATAAARLVGADRSDVIGAYDVAFGEVMVGLALVTALCGLAAYWALGRRASPTGPAERQSAERAGSPIREGCRARRFDRR